MLLAVPVFVTKEPPLTVALCTVAALAWLGVEKWWKRRRH
jgi:hypothetical protein